MAKATLHFDLNDPDDLRSFTLASRAENMRNVLFQITANMFKAMEYEAESGIDNHELLEKIRKYIFEELEDNDLIHIIDL